MEPVIQSLPGLHWAPVRHHSPQCAWQARRLIEKLRPERIFIEGPSEAGHLLPYIQDPQARPPLAVYLFAQGNAKALESTKHFRAFIPLAAMSPEWVALQTAARLDIPAHFIDLPYRMRLTLSSEPQEHRYAEEKILNDDHLIAQAKPMDFLLEQSGCRDFDEWWERHFESGVHYSDPETFFDQVQRFGVLLRQNDEEQDEETLARESWMADQVRPHLEAGKRSLILCGAYHCAGILRFLETPRPAPAGLDVFESGVHLVPYSLQRLNRAGGYAAGMPDCGYYAAVWNKLSRRRQANAPFEEVHIELTTALTRHLRDQGYPVTLPDAVEINLMARRLADLRGYHPGRWELRDAIDSCFLKQARDGSELAFQRQVDRFLAGAATGRLPGRMPLSPLVEDFRRLGRQFRWPLSATEIREKPLDIYRRDGHREQSRHLHQLAFLGVPYAEFVAGPRFSTNEDLTRVREIWHLHWHPESEARLTECSHYGSNLTDAALHCLLERLTDSTGRGPDQVALLVDALSMGLHDVLEPVLRAVRDWLHQETELLPLCHALNQLSLAYFSRSALAGRGLSGLEQTLSSCFERICVRIPWAGQLSDENADALCDALAGMHGFVVTKVPDCSPELFHDALEALLEYTTLAQLQGVSCAILWVVERIDTAAMARAFTDAFGEAGLAPERVGRFLYGFLRVARGRLSKEPELLELITNRFLEWDESEFIEVLPALRLAFTQLSPRETRELARRLAQDKAHELTENLPWSPQDLMRAAALRQDLLQTARLWGVV
jgi:hypothetical protein